MDAGPYEFFSDFNAGFTGVSPEELAAHPEWLNAPSYLGFQDLMGLREEIAGEHNVPLYEARKRIVPRAYKALGISRAELVYPHKYTNAQVADALQRVERRPDKKADNDKKLPSKKVLALAYEINHSKASKTAVARSFVASRFPDYTDDAKEIQVQSLLRELRPDRHGDLLTRKKIKRTTSGQR